MTFEDLNLSLQSLITNFYSHVDIECADKISCKRISIKNHLRTSFKFHPHAYKNWANLNSLIEMWKFIDFMFEHTPNAGNKNEKIHYFVVLRSMWAENLMRQSLNMDQVKKKSIGMGYPQKSASINFKYDKLIGRLVLFCSYNGAARVC